MVQRLGSAIVLAFVVAILTFAGLWPFALMVSAGAIILAWEWGRLVRGRTWDAVFFVHAACTVVACLLGAAQPGSWLPALALAAGCIVAPFLASEPQHRIWSLLGIVYIGLPCWLLVVFRSDPSFGVAAVFFLLAIVAATDTAAYFVGRTLGGPKLAPAISPGKTWSGFAGGIVLPTILAYAFALWLGGTSAIGVTLTGASLSLASQIGDLAESAIKRKFNVKDSGQLLPGHGGLLDRVDGLMGAALAAGCLAAIRDTVALSQAILIWP
ncbi:MAG: phosphatidate cytidylyltransferase [Hyphomicrobiaceae bacterium]|nr:phosphatidate cytidylyltransferase [Hyphomicrobiaceae bacterium]